MCARLVSCASVLISLRVVYVCGSGRGRGGRWRCSEAVFPIMQAILHVLSEAANVWGRWRLEFAIHGLDLGFVRADINNTTTPPHPTATTTTTLAAPAAFAGLLDCSSPCLRVKIEEG